MDGTLRIVREKSASEFCVACTRRENVKLLLFWIGFDNVDGDEFEKERIIRIWLAEQLYWDVNRDMDSLFSLKLLTKFIKTEHIRYQQTWRKSKILQSTNGEHVTGEE